VGEMHSRHSSIWVRQQPAVTTETSDVSTSATNACCRSANVRAFADGSCSRNLVDPPGDAETSWAAIVAFARGASLGV